MQRGKREIKYSPTSQESGGSKRPTMTCKWHAGELRYCRWLDDRMISLYCEQCNTSVRCEFARCCQLTVVLLWGQSSVILNMFKSTIPEKHRWDSGEPDNVSLQDLQPQMQMVQWTQWKSCADGDVKQQYKRPKCSLFLRRCCTETVKDSKLLGKLVCTSGVSMAKCHNGR